MDYQQEQKNNREAFIKALRQAIPDLAYIIEELDNTQVNPFVINKVITAIADIATDPKYGQVVIEIENGVVRFVRGMKANKLNEPAIINNENNVL